MIKQFVVSHPILNSQYYDIMDCIVISFYNMISIMSLPISSMAFLCPLQVSEAGVHRPHVGGIHGRSNDGSYSLVLAGGFEDEVVGYLYFSPNVYYSSSLLLLW